MVQYKSNEGFSQLTSLKPFDVNVARVFEFLQQGLLAILLDLAHKGSKIALTSQVRVVDLMYQCVSELRGRSKDIRGS